MKQREDIVKYAQRITDEANSGHLIGLIALEKRSDGMYNVCERGHFSMDDGDGLLIMVQLVHDTLSKQTLSRM